MQVDDATDIAVLVGAVTKGSSQDRTTTVARQELQTLLRRVSRLAFASRLGEACVIPLFSEKDPDSVDKTMDGWAAKFKPERHGEILVRRVDLISRDLEVQRRVFVQAIFAYIQYGAWKTGKLDDVAFMANKLRDVGIDLGEDGHPRCFDVTRLLYPSEMNPESYTWTDRPSRRTGGQGDEEDEDEDYGEGKADKKDVLAGGKATATKDIAPAEEEPDDFGVAEQEDHAD